MSRLRRGAATVPAMALLFTGVAMVSTADAATNAVTTCGTVITAPGTYTLKNDIGPCPGDGVDIRSSGVTLKLAGHTITGSDTTNNTTDQQVGVNLMGVSGVTVTGPGTITNFDAGVAINGGSGNKVQNLSVRDNIAHVLFTGGVNPQNPVDTPCDFGDGITVDNSSSNVISGNTASHNGPFSGIALVDNSDSNIVRNNTVTNNTVPNILGPNAGPNAGSPGPCGPFGASGPGVGRPDQNIGIRIEGPGANHNVIQDNKVTDNLLEGIAIFDNICGTSPGNGGPPPTPANDDNLILSNTVLHNGFTDVQRTPPTDGIAILQQGPGGIVCVPSGNLIKGNTSSSNARDGIFLAGRGSHDNTVTGNTVKNNVQDGIAVSGPSGGRRNGNPVTLPGSINNTLTNNVGRGNGRFDGADFNLTPPCDNNTWAANKFTTVNQPCVADNGGTGRVPTP